MPPRRREKGTGAVRRLPSGRWQARVLADTGGMVSIGSYATKGDAAQALRLAAGDQVRGQWIDPRSGQLRFADYAAEWLAGRSTIGPRTAELYRSLLRNHIVGEFGTTPLVDITPRRIRSWHAQMLDRSRPGPITVAKAYRLLRSILGTAVEDELINKNPCVIKGAGVENSPERPTASIDDVYRIAAAVDARYRALILLATFAALRFGELAALTRKHVDLDNGLITINQAAVELNDGTRRVQDPKSRAGRRKVAIPAALFDDLSTHLDTFAAPGRDGLVFVGPNGGPLRRSNWSKVWRRTLTDVDLPDLHFHDLRHTGNTLAAATGASTKELMTRMGHSSSRAALIYQHASMERELAIADRLSEMITSSAAHHMSLSVRDRDGLSSGAGVGA